MHFWVGSVRQRHCSINQDILKALKNMKNKYIDEGYHITFTKPVTLIIWLKRSGFFFLFLEGYSRDIIPRNLQSTPEYSEEEESEEEREEESEEPVINTDKSFKSSECIICLTNPPNVLFCDCGHLCLCVECDEVKGLDVCPVC